MTFLAQFFANVSFLEVGLTFVAIGVIERALLLLPETIVGNGGWLLDLGPRI